MNTKRHAQSGFLGSRALIILLLCAVASLVLAGSLLGFFRAEAPAKVSYRTLTFAERVSYQRAIEGVYWRHRLWPKERPDPKPRLDAMISQAQLEAKVADYLRNSQALEDYWQPPITAQQLQAEMDRMAQHTKQPDVLRELFEALGDDPVVIAECLARPVLTERLTADLSEQNKTSHGQSAWTKGLRSMTIAITSGNAAYILPKIFEGAPPCIDDTWTATSTTNAPSARAGHSAVWTGSEMIVWGGGSPTLLNTGGRYTPSTDTWIATSTTDAPSARHLHTAVWTGSEMIVWGGYDGISRVNTGARYNPGTDSWTATSTTNAPIGRERHTAVWTDSEMIIWGGFNFPVGDLNTGGRYNPVTDSWTATSNTNAPTGREYHTAVWTGTEMIVWGGLDSFGNLFNTGGKYNPDTNSWTATSTTSAPSARAAHTAVWTASEMIVWGGGTFSADFDTGGRYNPITDSWATTSTTNAPSPRESHTAVWITSEMIIWGGVDFTIPNYFDTGGRYDPAMDSWTATSTTNAPSARAGHTAVWTTSEMIIWGGYNGFYSNTGGRYCAQVGPTPTPTPTATASPTPTPTPITTPTATPGPCQFRVLIAYADISGQPDMLRNQILAEPDVIAVDYFDAFSGTPTLPQLGQYDIVFAFSNNVWNDAVAMGNVLADYEDGGGIVLVATFAWDSGGGWLLQGRWITDGYSPYNSTNQQNFTCNNANITDPSHPLMQGVSSLNACFRDALTLAAGASAVAVWTDGPPAVAYKTNNGHNAVGINAYLGHLGQFSGEFGRVIVNGGRWLRACGGSPTPTPSATATATPTPTPTPSATPSVTPTATPTATPTTTPTPTATATSTPTTPRPTPTPRLRPTPRPRPTARPQ
jgi:N-acetylneuraminic acid mutarotase/cell division septation protein DedD